MITYTNPTGDKVAKYQDLFDSAYEALCGFDRIYAYESANGETYYYKIEDEQDNVSFESITILDANDFIEALKLHHVLFLKSDRNPDNGFDRDLKITTVDEYFHWIADLGAINRKFTMLPLEELTDDVFIINANTRGINVPNNFKKNGIAVQGDHAAEVVYFKIDR